MKKISVILFFTLFYAGAALWAEGTITVHVSGIRPDSGDSIALRLISSEQEFAAGGSYAKQHYRLTANESRYTFVLTGIPAGTYMILGLNDANGNEQMDSNFFGIPTEGYFATDNPKQPEYSRNNFYYDGSNLTIELTMIYYS